MARASAAALKDNLLRCTICRGECEDPRVLPCYHTFCYGCISDHAKKNATSSRTFPCPSCSEEIQFPKDGLVALKKDFRTHAFSYSHRAEEVLSQLQQHKVISPHKDDVTKAISQMTIRCERHPGTELKYYCEEDDAVLCGDCVPNNFRHRILTIEKVANSSREKIQSELVKSAKKINKFKEALATEMPSEGKDNHIRAATIHSIEEQAQHICSLVNQRKDILISEVNAAYDTQKKQTDKDSLKLHHASLCRTCDFAQQLVVHGTDSDVMVHAKALIKRMEAMENIPVPTPDTHVQISFIPGKISSAGLEAMFGELTEQLQPTLAKHHATNPRSAPHHSIFIEKTVCVHSFNVKLKDDNAEMYITGLAIDERHVFAVDKENGRTKVFSHAGKFMFDIKLKEPCGVAVSKTGKLYITSQREKCVKVYSTKGQQVTTMGQDRLEMPRGITLSIDHDHLLVCESKKKSIFTFNADSGQLLNTIPLRMCNSPEYITASLVNDNIVLSDFGKNSVYVIAPTGDQLHQYGTEGSGDGQLNWPCGVCTDNHGHIFIADFQNHRIVALSPHGQFIKYIATSDDGLKYPSALAINSIGQLVVAQQDGNIKTFKLFN